MQINLSEEMVATLTDAVYFAHEWFAMDYRDASDDERQHITDRMTEFAQAADMLADLKSRQPLIS